MSKIQAPVYVFTLLSTYKLYFAMRNDGVTLKPPVIGAKKPK